MIGPRALLARAVSAGLPGLVVSTFAVQGVTYLVQLALAPLLGPAAFGVVRTVEALVGVGAIVAAAGMPTLIMRYAAERADTTWRATVARRLLAAAAVAGTVVALGLALLAPLFATSEAASWTRWLAPSAALTALARTGVSYFFGTGRPRIVPRLSVPAAVVGGLLVVGGGATLGLRGWAGARLTSDLLLLVVVFWAVRRDTSGEARDPDPRLALSALLASGLPLALSLVARSTMDNAPLLVLARTSASPTTRGIAGLVLLVASGLLVVPAGVVNLAVPRMVERAQRDRLALARFHSRLTLLAIGVTALPGLALALAARPLADRFLPAYAPGVDVLGWLLVATAPRVASSLAGTALLAVDHIRTSLVVTVASLAVLLPALVMGWEARGLVGLVAATLAAEGASAIAFFLVARRAILAPSN